MEANPMWLGIFFLSFALLIGLLMVPTTEDIEEEKEALNDWQLSLRRSSMQCYGNHDWVVNKEGKRVCRKCEYAHPEETEEPKDEEPK